MSCPRDAVNSEWTLPLKQPSRPRFIEASLARFTPREILIRLNEDLFRIDQFVQYPWFSYPSNLYQVILFTEDRRFHHHWGVDIRAILREILRLIGRRRMYGASTIDMQFVRTCLNRRQRTAARKFTEIILAVLINFRYSKLEIFNAYMRYAYFGHGITGLDEAVNAIYGTPYKAVFTLDEAAFLAACMVFPIPSNRNTAWQRRVVARQQLILERIRTHKKQFEKVPDVQRVELI